MLTNLHHCGVISTKILWLYIPEIPDCCLEVTVYPEGAATCLFHKDFHDFPLPSSKFQVASACFPFNTPDLN
jgi:hypothetical protein